MAVRETDAFEQLGAHFGLQSRVPHDLRRTPVQYVLGGGILSLRIERIGLRENVDQKCGHLLCPIALLRGRLASQLDTMILPERDARDERKA